MIVSPGLMIASSTGTALRTAVVAPAAMVKVLAVTAVIFVPALKE